MTNRVLLAVVERDRRCSPQTAIVDPGGRLPFGSVRAQSREEAVGSGGAQPVTSELDTVMISRVFRFGETTSVRHRRVTLV